MKNKLTKAILVSLACILAIVVFASCDFAAKDNSEIESIKVTAPEVIYFGEFDQANITIHVNYVDGSTKDIPLTYDMLSAEDKAKVDKGGDISIIYEYEGELLRVGLRIEDRSYRVRFLDVNKNVISEQNVKKGSAAVEPTEAQRKVDGYRWTGWQGSFDVIIADTDINGLYTRVPYYSVTFYGLDNEILSMQRVMEGESAVAPAEDEVAVYGYRWLGWDKEFTEVTGNINVYARYEQVPVYIVTFYGFDDEVLSEQEVMQGESAVAPAEDEVAVVGYRWLGWDKEFTEVTGNINVYARYEQVPVYIVTFYGFDDEVLSEQEVMQGESAVAPAEDEVTVVGYRWLGWDEEFDAVIEDLDIYAEYVKTWVVNFYNSDNQLLKTEIVDENTAATEPTAAEKAKVGYTFLAWDKAFNNIVADLNVYGSYAPDYITDTDGDGLPDYYELEIIGTSYLLTDTDGNGVSDYYEDYDSDGSCNGIELLNGTDLTDPDSDDDGLKDGEEILLYNTDPLNPDTDGDGANDGWEVLNCFDPTTYNESFTVSVKAPEEDEVEVGVQIENLSGEQAQSLSITQSTDVALEDIPGSIGNAYDFSVQGTFESATISFEYEEELNQDDNFDPVIFYFNENENEIEVIPTTIEGNVATATVTHFSTYMLVDRYLYEKQFRWQDVWQKDENYTSVEVVFVIDDSGSMTSYDSSNQRLTVARTLIDSLPESSKIGIVKFASSTTILTSSLITNRTTAKNYLTTSYFRSSGNTYMYTAINNSWSLYQSSDPSVMKVMIVMSDGIAHDTSSHNSTIQAAKNRNVKIYTVGLGSGNTSYFNSYLKPLAEGTGGKFYLSNNASGLAEIYEDIGDKIDILTDSDNDGLPDYYEDNLVLFDGREVKGLDKNNPDTDGDGALDGEEIKIYFYYSNDRKKVIVTGRWISDPFDSIDKPKSK